MTAGDFRSMVEAELDETVPPEPLDGPAIAAMGRRSIRRRRLGGALSALAALAAITVAAGLVVGGPGGTDTAGDLSSLPPKATYWWQYGEPETTPQSVAMTQALWGALSAIDGFEFGLSGNTPYLEPEDFPSLHRLEAQLWDDTDPRHDEPDEDRVGPQVPVYTFDHDIYLMVSTPGTAAMSLDVRVLPSGSYLRQPPFERSFKDVPYPVDPYVEPYCVDWDLPDVDSGADLRVEYTCERTALESGEELLRAEAEVRPGPGTGAGAGWLRRTVVVYTAAGDAVMLSGLGSPAGPDTGLSGSALDLDQLTAIASALAAVPLD
ncbi:hypothetical protein AB0I28_20585 [Phytomonospora sp. NPDC050363]|uniref:hypothetical protein n=1 Tax=Phytomonospora sp. NPDC050363 TaxID=3155642 RepID=UPI0033EB83FD